MKQQTEFGEIPLEWQVKQVIDIKDESKRSIAMGPFGSNIKAENFVSEGVPVIRGTNMNYAKFVDGDFVYLTEDKADDLIGSNCKPNDLVFTHRGTIGQVALIPSNKFQRYVISQSGMKLTVNSQLMDSEFLFYFFKSEYGQYQILKYESQVGVPSISNPLTSLKEMAVPVPPLPEQKAIASVLSSLDDKIDLLHRQNKTLEAMAETLFRQWFIEEASDDWQESTIGDIFTIKGGGTPSTKELSYWNGGIAWTSPRDLSTAKSLYMFRTDRTITKAGLAKVSSGLLPTGTLLMSSRAPIGYLALTDIEVAINQGYIAILKHTLYSNQFMYLWCKANMELIKNSGNGSVFQEISKASFRDLPFTCPPKPLVDEFNNLVKDWFDKIKLNAKQIQTLEQLRDTLLPKLMSGEVRVMY